jgi:hypothetical protein
MLVAAVAAVAIAACGSSSSSSKPASVPLSGQEHITGTVTGKALEAKTTVIPLKFTGPVVAASSITLNGPAPKKGQTHTFVTSKGNLVASITANPVSKSVILNKKTCLGYMSTTVVFSVDGAKSTGSFKGASGSGTVIVTFQARSELGGKCSMASAAQPVTLNGAYGSFTGGGPLTLAGK